MYLDDFNTFYYELFDKYNLDVEVVPVFSGIHLFLSGGVDASSFMWYNEYHRIMNSGYNSDELNTIFLKDYGFDVPEDGIYCMEETWQNNPEICSQFVNATMEAWVYAFEHQQETLAIVMKYMKKAHVPGHIAHQQWMLSTMEKIIQPDQKMEISTLLDKEDFTKTLHLLLNDEAINHDLEYEQFFKAVGKYAK